MPKKSSHSLWDCNRGIKIGAKGTFSGNVGSILIMYYIILASAMLDYQIVSNLHFIAKNG